MQIFLKVIIKTEVSYKVYFYILSVFIKKNHVFSQSEDILPPPEKELYEILNISHLAENKTYEMKKYIELFYMTELSLKEFLLRNNFLNDNKAVSVYMIDYIPLAHGK